MKKSGRMVDEFGMQELLHVKFRSGMIKFQKVDIYSCS